MRVDQLTLTGFRSYARLDLRLGDGPQVIVGDNAAGKTNLIEAIVVLARGASHRSSTDAELIRWGEPLTRLEAGVAHGPARGPDRIEVTLERGVAGGARKRMRVDGVPRRAVALGEALRVVLFAPEEMLLVVGQPSLRRTAIDALAGARSPAYGRAMATYGRALQQRNGLLRRIRDGEAETDQLPYWSAIIIEHGGAIVGQRLALLADLAPILAASHAQIAPAEPELRLRYVTNAPADADETPEMALRRRLTETAEKELWNGATLVGPHRDDIAFELGGRDLASFASRGQQRTAILSLKLAELDLLTDPVTGEAPLLLLDDVFSELDPDRRAHLVRRIRGLPQTLVTTTTLDDLDPILVAESATWHVRDGVVEAGLAGAAR
ncbi:MAG TPA: DNA replication/repair protein RecF [Candidatus Saccharimonadia bacterium]|nr:DNA replication/repair protein RecF [Candidatus Saccharimonadia bacterium]